MKTQLQSQICHGTKYFSAQAGWVKTIFSIDFYNRRNYFVAKSFSALKASRNFISKWSLFSFGILRNNFDLIRFRSRAVTEFDWKFHILLLRLITNLKFLIERQHYWKLHRKGSSIHSSTSSLFLRRHMSFQFYWNVNEILDFDDSLFCFKSFWQFQSVPRRKP